MAGIVCLLCGLKTPMSRISASTLSLFTVRYCSSRRSQAQTGGMTLFALDGSQKPIPVGSRKGSSRQGKISPNGKFIAFTSNESGRDEIYIQAMPPGTAYRNLSINGGHSPRWSHDGKELFFVSPDAEMMAVETLDPVNSPGVPHRL